MLAKYAPLIIAVLVVVIVILGSYLYSYITARPVKETTTITSTVTHTVTKTVTFTVLRTVTYTATPTVSATVPQSTTTITVPVTTTLTVTVPPTPKPTPTTTSPLPVVNVTPSRVYGVVGNVEYMAWSTAPMPDVKGSMIFPVPGNANVSMVASMLSTYIKQAEAKKISLSNTVISMSITGNQNLAVLLTLFRGNPCTYYRVEVVDGDLSDGLGVVKVVKYSTSDVCIQVVPPDNQFNVLLLLKDPSLQSYKLVIEYSDGTRTASVTINVSRT